MTLHTKTLQQAREELAKKRGWNSYEHRTQYYKGEPKENTIEFETEAALLAMAKQWSFSIWIRSAGYKKISDSLWANRRTYEKHTTEELYEIWEASSS